MGLMSAVGVYIQFYAIRVGGTPNLPIIAMITGSWPAITVVLACVFVGATYPEELREVRKIVGDTPILTAGIGAQNGDLEKILKAGLDSKRDGLIINASRSIIFASSGKDFAEAARTKASTIHNAIVEARSKV